MTAKRGSGFIGYGPRAGDDALGDVEGFSAGGLNRVQDSLVHDDRLIEARISLVVMVLRFGGDRRCAGVSDGRLVVVNPILDSLRPETGIVDVEFSNDRVVLVGLLRVNVGPLKSIGRKKILRKLAGFVADERQGALLAQGFGHMEQFLGGGVVAVANVDQESVECSGRHGALMDGVILDGIETGDAEILFEGEGLLVALLGSVHVRFGGVVLRLVALLVSQRIADRLRELPAFRISHIFGVFDGKVGGGTQDGAVFVGHHEFIRIGLNVGAASHFFGADVQASRRHDAGRPEVDAEFRLNGADDAGLLVIAEPESVLCRPFIHGVSGIFGKGLVDGTFRLRNFLAVGSLFAGGIDEGADSRP